MAYLVDANIMVDFTRGNAKAADYLDTLGDACLLSAITALELIAGARRSAPILRICSAPLPAPPMAVSRLVCPAMVTTSPAVRLDPSADSPSSAGPLCADLVDFSPSSSGMFGSLIRFSSPCQHGC